MLYYTCQLNTDFILTPFIPPWFFILYDISKQDEHFCYINKDFICVSLKIIQYNFVTKFFMKYMNYTLSRDKINFKNTNQYNLNFKFIKLTKLKSLCKIVYPFVVIINEIFNIYGVYALNIYLRSLSSLRLYDFEWVMNESLFKHEHK